MVNSGRLTIGSLYNFEYSDNQSKTEFQASGTVNEYQNQSDARGSVEPKLTRRLCIGLQFYSFMHDIIMEDERSNIFHRLKQCTFGVELLGSGSLNMASAIVHANALGGRFDNLN